MENYADDQIQHMKGVIEALLFISEKPVMLDQIKDVLETVPPADIKTILELLKKEFETRKSGMSIVEIAEGYQMLSNSAYASYIRSFYKVKHKEKLSKPALETLAIVAYKQPVTRSDVELLRSVNSDGVVTHLLAKELIKVVGRKDVPGKPYIYGTTKQFLEYFGLKSLTDLPKLEEFEKLQPVGELPADKVLSPDSPMMEAPAEQEASSENKAQEEAMENETAGEPQKEN